MAERKFLDYSGLQEYDELIKGVISSGDNAVKSSLTSGSITVAKAEHATSADTATSATTAGSATKATQDASGNVITSTYETKTDATAKLAEAKEYADSIKNDLLNGAGAAYDTLKELGDLIDDNADAIDVLEGVAAGKADKTHTHTVSQISDLTATAKELNYMDGVTSNVQTQLDGKAASSHTHGNITNAGAIGTASGKAVITTTNGVLTTGTVPVASGGTGATTAAGALTNLGLTATASELNIMDGVTATAAEINKLDGLTATTAELNYVDGVTSNIQTQLDGKAASSHSHTITAAATDDDVIVLTGTNGSNKVTFDAKHATSGVTAGTYKSVTVNAYGHVTAGSNPTTLSGYGITDAYTKTQVDSAVNAVKVTVDTALSTTSTNPVQNKVINSAISTLTSTVSANTSSIGSHTTAIGNLQTAVGEFTEITSAEISALFT